MSNIYNSGRRPAFPTKGPFEPGLENSSFAYPGITIRDWFAGQAMSALISGMDGKARLDIRHSIAADAYAMADAMLKAREALS